MKTLLITISSVVLLLGCGTSSKKVNSDQQFQPRASEELVLSNGLRVLLVKDKSLPYISLNLMVMNGSANDPVGKEGLTAMMTSLLEKGSKRKNANVIANILGQMASEFSESVGTDTINLKVDSLSRSQDDLISIFSEIVQEPAFNEKEIEILRAQYLSMVSKLSDNPSGFSDQLIDQYLFENHPYGRPKHGTLKSLKMITRNDITKHYQNLFQPNRVWLAVVGSYDENIKKNLESKFGSWKNEKTNTELKLVTPEIKGLKLRLVDKPQLVQTQIRFAQIGVARSNPDFLKLRIANSILGSGFTSRLVNRVRDELGLTYHISSQVDAMGATGAFEIRTFTKNESVKQAISETLNTFKEFVQKGVTESEVTEAKSFMIGQFPQVVETAEAWTQNLLVLRRYQVPDTYLTQFNQNVEKISSKDINEVIKKYYTPENLRIVALATRSAVEEQMKSFGQTEVVDFKDFQ